MVAAAEDARFIAESFPGEAFSDLQYQILARIASGEDVRSWDVGGHQPMIALIERQVIDAEAATGRLYLLTADVVVARLAQVERDIACAVEMIDEIAAAIEIGQRVLVRAQQHAAAASSALAMVAAGRPSIGDLSVARAAHSEAVLDLGEQQSADRRRREQLDAVSASLRDLRREKLRLELAARCRLRSAAA